LKEVLRKGFSGLFVDFHELLSEIRDTYDELAQTSELQILRPILNVDVLVLDDLGSQRMTDWVKDTVFHIINLRYNQNKTLLITTNLELERSDSKRRTDFEKRLSQDTLQDRLGYPVVSRLYEMCTQLECTWKDGDKFSDFRKVVKSAGRENLDARKGKA
ncbi:MAG TPA: ATP-binding protein, partial [Acidobacteriota bacterium]|nr:ATP-binding protein [Acidobacteriota bacterium]